jgi:threonine/homoserine/homoserine lactone efflux protein
MSIEAWLAYVAATAVLVVSSRPTILTVIGYSMAHGKRARVLLAQRATT